MRPKFIKYFMDFAELTANLSYAKRLKVGAIIVKDNGQIIGNGYNGMPTGWDNNCEHKEYMGGAGGWLSPEECEYGWPFEDEEGKRYGLKTRPEVIHAESNALIKVARSTESSEGATMFCTHAPCMDCAKLIYQAGIKTLYYKTQYRDDAGLMFLRVNEINVHQCPDSI